MKVKYSYFTVALAVAFFISSVALPVRAESVNDSGVEIETQKLEDFAKDTEAYKKEIETKKQQLKERAEQKAIELNQQAEARAQEAKNKVNQKSIEVRKQICQKNATKINSAINKQAETTRAFYERFSGFNDKIDRFIEAKSLNVDNYSQLNANVLNSSVKAEEAITTLEGLKFEINCDEVDLFTANAQNYRDSIVVAKEALKEYKTALANLLNNVVTSYDATNSVKSEDSNTGSINEGANGEQ